MAANDYYKTPYSSSQARPDALPSNPTPHDVSPVSTPLDDHHFPPYSSTANDSGALGGYHDTAYYGGASTPSIASHNNMHSQCNNHGNRYDPPGKSNNDPFADNNAIPLQHQPKADNTPGAYGAYGADPEQYPPRRRSSAKRKKGWFSGRITWVVYTLTLVQIGVFVGELIKNGILTGSPIQTKPNFNIMIGPSPYVLINMGARFTPCMHNINSTISAGVTQWPCPNTTSLAADTPKCTLSELCGMGGVPDQTGVTDFRDRSKEPNQWWRFIVPMFLHAGIIHIGFNMLLQLTLGRDMEKEIGPLRFALVYFSSGIFGFVLGGNYAADGITSVGASGCLFGILALHLLDLFYNWSSRRSPVKDLLFLLLDIAIAFVLGLLPGLDNFSHIGGFLMGLVLGICLLHSPQTLRQRIGHDEPPYAEVDAQPLAPTASPSGATQASGVDKGMVPQTLSRFAKAPVGFFKGRKPLWWAWWLVRAGSLVAVFIGFILLLRNFYEWRNTCSWCHHLTCLPIKTNGVEWCDIGGLNLTKSNSKRDIFAPMDMSMVTAQAMGMLT